ncbi:hypothetical protein, partial [Brevundimonas mediterranea]
WLVHPHAQEDEMAQPRQPGALGLIAVLIVALARPLAPGGGSARHTLAGLAAAMLILGCGLSLAARHAEPAAEAPVAVP